MCTLALAFLFKRQPMGESIKTKADKQINMSISQRIINMKTKHFIHYTFWVLFLCIGTISVGKAQSQQADNFDRIYADNIFSVKFHINGLVLSYPFIEINSGAVLSLKFDDLDADVKNYFYTIQHCDMNWAPSDLDQMEYIEGFTEERIMDYEFSFKTFWPFTQYTLYLPNRDMRWTLPGNYLLTVYDDSNDRKVAFTRRFVVFEGNTNIIPRIVRAAQVSKLRTHQEIDFVVGHETFRINNPQQEIRATILQNGRWDNAIMNVEPKFIRPGEMRFDHQDKIVFPGGKEFRRLDIRSLRVVDFNVASVEQNAEGYFITMKTDQRRDKLAYTTFNDIEGNFIISTNDQQNNQLSSEYVDILFSLAADYRPEHDIYLFGGFTDWLIQPAYKMEYDAAVNAYIGGAFLKQGYYDYMYAAVPKVPNSKRESPVVIPDISMMEGSSNEAVNGYTIIIYYRPFGSRFDRPVGSLTFSSNL
jgi:hypothetical protein